VNDDGTTEGRSKARTARRAHDMEQVPMSDRHALPCDQEEINSSKPKLPRQSSCCAVRQASPPHCP